MSKVLYIKANIKQEGESRTFKVSDSFVEEYKKNNPNDEVVVLDLYKENIDFLRPEDLGVIFGPKNEESKNNPKLKYAYQFAEADKYIIAAPMWNLSFPAILKAYIDYVSVTGITFKYTAEGPVGLLNNKKAIHIVASVSTSVIPKNPNIVLKYLSPISYGALTYSPPLAIENLDVIGADVEGKVNDAINKAIPIAKNF